MALKETVDWTAVGKKLQRSIEDTLKNECSSWEEFWLKLEITDPATLTVYSDAYTSTHAFRASSSAQLCRRAFEILLSIATASTPLPPHVRPREKEDHAADVLRDLFKHGSSLLEVWPDLDSIVGLLAHLQRASERLHPLRNAPGRDLIAELKNAVKGRVKLELKA